MRWWVFFILAYVAVGLQLGLSPLIGSGAAAPNFVLLACIFVALHAPRQIALLSCFVLGLSQDLTAVGPVGLYALSYGLVGMFIVAVQDIVTRSHPLTHVFLAVVGGLIATTVLAVHGWLRADGAPLGALLLGIVYTALLSPVLVGILHRSRRVFAFTPPRTRVR